MSKKLHVINSYSNFDYTPDMIKESRELNDGKIILKGILQKAETVNQNGRIYPKAILERELRNYQKFIQENRALGECDHPDSSVVELKNVSHIIREAHLEGDVVYGSVELLDTPCGKILQSLVESGVKLGISSRGVGSTKRQGQYQVVQDDFQLICWDFVSEPSTPGAFVMREGKQLVTEADLDAFFNNSDKVDRIFNEILDWE
mgnify:CR=1 FL=1|tara:strand:- start:2761 stop:3372 length:612 start_codon:yes stop_codon:yes gene_type:complete